MCLLIADEMMDQPGHKCSFQRYKIFYIKIFPNVDLKNFYFKTNNGETLKVCFLRKSEKKNFTFSFILFKGFMQFVVCGVVMEHSAFKKFYEVKHSMHIRSWNVIIYALLMLILLMFVTCIKFGVSKSHSEQQFCSRMYIEELNFATDF